MKCLQEVRGFVKVSDMSTRTRGTWLYESKLPVYT